jgi:hypothetical protein
MHIATSRVFPGPGIEAHVSIGGLAAGTLNAGRKRPSIHP